MKKMLFAIGVCASMLVQGQDLILDNNTIPLDPTAGLTIDPETGDIVVRSNNGSLVCIDDSQANAPQLTLSASPETFSTSATTAVVTWQVSGADSCTASNAWNGSKTSDDGTYNQNVSITQTSIFELTCSNAFGSVQKSAVSAKTGTVTSPTAPTLSMSASPTSVQPSGSSTISWNLGNVQAGATCTASGDWLGARSAQAGNNSLLVTDINPPATFALSCQNPGSSAATSQVIVGIQGSSECSNQPAPAGLIEQRDPESFEDTGIIWDVTIGNTGGYRLIRDQYSALDFVSPSGNSSKRIFFENGTPNNGPPANYTIAISECPGDFNTHLNQTRCKRSGQTPSLSWTTDPANANNRCLLEKNKQYYLNIIHSLDPPYTNSVCSSASGCSVLFQQGF